MLPAAATPPRETRWAHCPVCRRWYYVPHDTVDAPRCPVDQVAPDQYRAEPVRRG